MDKLVIIIDKEKDLQYVTYQGKNLGPLSAVDIKYRPEQEVTATITFAYVDIQTIEKK